MQTQYGQLPAIRIEHPDGAQAIVTTYGGHLVSWKTADGVERLFMSERSALDGSKAIRGGVPVIFPQFAERGTGTRHGFARTAIWRTGPHGVDADGSYAEFALGPQDLPERAHANFPYDFALVLRISLHAQMIAFTLRVANRGARPFPFAAALHSYFAVPDVAQVRVEGLPGIASLAIGDKHDQIYRGISGPLHFDGLTLSQSGFEDAVVWNPGAADSALLADMAPHEYQRFLCVEAAAIEPPELAGGAAWTARHVIRA